MIKGGLETVWQFGKGKIDAGRLVNMITDNLNKKMRENKIDFNKCRGVQECTKTKFSKKQPPEFCHS